MPKNLIGVLILVTMLTACALPVSPTATNELAPIVPTILPTIVPTLVLLPTTSPTLGSLPTPSPELTTIPSPTTRPTIVPSPSTTLPVIVPTALIPGSNEALEQQLLVLVNALRIEAEVVPYPLSQPLSTTARAHSCDMASNGYIGHTDSQGRNVADRVPSGLPWQWYSESVAAGSADPAVIIALWMDEPPNGWHRRNILDADRVVAGIGYCHREDAPAGNQYYWTMIVAR
jgi:uncharacterized protein YkwD